MWEALLSLRKILGRISTLTANKYAIGILTVSKGSKATELKRVF